MSDNCRTPSADCFRGDGEEGEQFAIVVPTCLSARAPYLPINAAYTHNGSATPDRLAKMTVLGMDQIEPDDQRIARTR
jgi:hypothetical protein